MKSIYFYILLFIGLVSLSSCYHDIDMNEYRSEPTLVLNAAISSDTVVMASISHTQFFYEIRETDVDIENADVKLFVNGGFKEKMVWKQVELNRYTNYSDVEDRVGIYFSSYRPKYGDRIKITADYNGQHVWAEDDVIKPVEIISVKPEIKKSDKSGGTQYVVDEKGNWVEQPIYGHEITYNITFKDVPDENNYYCIRLGSEYNYPLGETIDYSLDPVFIDQVDFIDGIAGQGEINGQGGRSFTDYLFEGKEYTMKIREPFGYGGEIPSESIYRRITLYSLSESYYKYLSVSLNGEEDTATSSLTQIGFIEPTKTHCNVIGGLGILGMVETSSVLIDITPYFPTK